MSNIESTYLFRDEAGNSCGPFSAEQLSILLYYNRINLNTSIIPANGTQSMKGRDFLDEQLHQSQKGKPMPDYVQNLPIFINAERVRINEQVITTAGNATHLHVYPSTLPILNTDTKNEDKRGDLFSGVLIEIDNRYFVATAAHCVQKRKTERPYWILSPQRTYESDIRPRVISSYFNNESFKKTEYDVGVIEFDKKELSDICPHLIPIGLDRVSIQGTGRHLHYSILVGSPCVSGQFDRDPTGKWIGYGAKVIALVTQPLSDADECFHAGYDPNVDMVLDYRHKPGEIIDCETKSCIELPHLEGMSGGGLWDLGFGNESSSSIWSPQNVMLTGIQSRWLENRYAVSTQIIHWLRLLYDNYPELQSHLEERFLLLRKQ